MVARAFAFGVASLALVACQDIRPMIGAANPLLQTAEGRREIVSLCHEAVQERISADSVRFAQGMIVNTDDYGDARYHGAVEGNAAGYLRRYSFICTVQASGTVDLFFR